MEHTKNSEIDLVLLAYASKINPDCSSSAVKLNTTTTHILGEANKNNHNKHLTGALYYGHQHFFQCIEGPKDTVSQLFKKIKLDTRHQQVECLMHKPIEERLFASWHMKFVHSHNEISEFFSDFGFDYFVPESLTEQQLIKLLLLIKDI